jgi:hypothetical protein
MNEAHGIQRSAAALLALCVLIGCGDDSSEEETREPPPPELTIAEVRTHSGATWQRGSADPLDLGCPPSAALVVRLGEPDPYDPRSLKNWLLRAPGACGTRTRCGHVSFELSSGGALVYRTDTALPAFGIAARDVTSPPGISAGTYGLRATLRTDEGAEFLLRGAPVSVTVDLALTTPANCVVNPGADAGSDAGE